MSTLVILNDSPDGTERTRSGLRLALTLSKGEWADVRVFLLGDGTLSARRRDGSSTDPQTTEGMLRTLANRGVEIGVSGACMDARGIDVGELVEGTHRSTLDALTAWVASATKTLVF